MDTVTHVDYAGMPAHITQMRRIAGELNEELVKAYKSVADMHSIWYGKRYNDLVKAFNEIIPSLNELTDLVVGQIPYALEIIANNYSNLDKLPNVTTPVRELPRKIPNIPVINDVGMKYISGEVPLLRQNIIANFHNAKEKMNNLEKEYSSIVWDTDASKRFKEEFTKTKNSIVSSFEKIETQFAQLMAETEQDVEKTENANKV